MIESIDTPAGRLILAVRGDALCALVFEEGWPAISAALTRRFGALAWASERSPVRARIERYFAGDLDAIDAIETDAEGTPFQKRVWTQLRTLRAGETIAYSELAVRVGSPTAARAVGAANGRNPIGIVVPCHRVIGKSGALTGYAGGMERKRWLLAHEARFLQVAPSGVASGSVPSTRARLALSRFVNLSSAR